MLHIVNKSPFQTSSLDSCLRLAHPGSALLLIEDGVSGTLYDSEDADALVAAIRRYLDERALREAHGAAARERCIAQFSMEAMVRGYSDLYDRLLARN